ncbi:MAG: M48 family metallopeptidase [Magnetococcales bacterium]|nr:M48 family metallopeptidase [Magnetococcales bacterium]
MKRMFATTGALVIQGEEVVYRLTRSMLRRRLTLRVAADGAVEVGVPWLVGMKRVEAFLREHGAWLLARREARRMPYLADGFVLPFLDEVLTLRVVGEEIARPRRLGDALQVPAPLTGGGLEVMVESWYRREALRHLPERVRARAREMGVSVSGVSIRAQKSRWGSCSSRGGIHLNWQLMLHPSRVVDYVIVHELCHRVHMNHSPAFWALVGTILPDYPLLKNQLKTIQLPWRSVNTDR